MDCMLALTTQLVYTLQTSHCCTDYDAHAGGQTPFLQVGTVQQPWAVLYVQSCHKLSLTLMLKYQISKGLFYQQNSLAVARAAKLQGSRLYRGLLKDMLDSCLKLYTPGLGVRHGEHAIPYEGFIAALAFLKQSGSEDYAEVDSFIQEHTCWVKELQAELVRCVRPAFSLMK